MAKLLCTFAGIIVGTVIGGVISRDVVYFPGLTLITIVGGGVIGYILAHKLAPKDTARILCMLAGIGVGAVLGTLIAGPEGYYAPVPALWLIAVVVGGVTGYKLSPKTLALYRKTKAHFRQ